LTTGIPQVLQEIREAVSIGSVVFVEPSSRPTQAAQEKGSSTMSTTFTVNFLCGLDSYGMAKHRPPTGP